ncbi:MAG: hypothetical protein IT249_02060 [Chitinophagaceae bacterium]|nr:hypothetical protein [Chitinophagaceae bacterium]
MERIIGTIKVLALACAWAIATPLTLLANEGKLKKEKTSHSHDSTAVVEIVSFTGVSTQNKIDLACKVKSNCCYSIFVERSRNGKKFYSIGSFSDNKALAEYTLSDESPLRQTNIYRLKIIDSWGKISYSKLMVVQLYDTEVLDMVSVTPNTLLNNLHINVQLKNKAMIVMRITDKDGNEIFKKKDTGTEGFNSYEMEGTGKMMPGNYFLEVLVNSKDRLKVPLIKS